MKKNRINRWKRDLQVTQGVYDGRFRLKVVSDKKKKLSKTICRKKVVV